MRSTKVAIGARVVVNSYVHIWGGGGVSIGDNSIIAAHAVITSQTHDATSVLRGIPYRDTNLFAAVVIGENVWIGSGAVILPGTRVGDGAIIGAGAVVTSDVPAYGLALGVPARITRSVLDRS